MSMFRLLLIALLVAAAPLCFAEDLPTGAEVMDKISEASGGAEAMSKITSAVTRGSMEVANLGISGSITTWSKPPGKVRAEIELPGIGMIERGANGDVAWETNPLAGPRILEGEERDMMLLESKIGWTADWNTYYESVECTGAEEVNGQPCVLLALTMKGGMKQTMAVNRETWQPATMNMSMDMQGNTIPVAITYDEYKEFGGLTLPVKITQHVLVQTIVVTFDAYVFNTEVPDERFALPESVQALIDAEAGTDDAAAEDGGDAVDEATEESAASDEDEG